MREGLLTEHADTHSFIFTAKQKQIRIILSNVRTFTKGENKNCTSYLYAKRKLTYFRHYFIPRIRKQKESDKRLAH